MEDAKARAVVAHWSGGGGVVPRGPTTLLSVIPVTAGDIERHIGRRPSATSGSFDFWRLEVGGRFLASSGVVYPGGVPYPEDLHNETPIVANEVWLYADDDGRIVGTYWWPDAVRKPIASVPREEYGQEAIFHPDDAGARLDFPLPRPDHAPWTPAVCVCLSRREVLVFCVADDAPDLLNEMFVYEHGGITVRAKAVDERPDPGVFLKAHQPPYRRVQVRLASGIARDPGRALGPQTWPWPGELRWWEKGISFEVKGALPVATLVEIAESIRS